jgi:hypothetical protein
MSKKLLVTVDSLRYDHFHLMENTKEYLTNEHESAFSVSTATSGSFPSIMCSQYPKSTNIENMTEFTSEINEYKVGITTNHLLSERYGYGRSFDYFECPRKEQKGLKTKVAKTFTDGSLVYRFLTFGWNNYQRIRNKFTTVDDSFRTSTDVIDTLLSKIDDEDDWFAWIHLMEPHHPYEPDCGDKDKVEYQNITRKVINGQGDEEDEKIAREGYRNEIIELDEDLEKLWSNLSDDTEIIFTSDHGELLGEYNSWGHPGKTVPELLHIPFATKNIDISDRSIISHIDIGSIFLDYEFGQGKTDREFAYASYGDKKAVITSDTIYNGKNVLNMKGDTIDNPNDLDKLNELLSNFNPEKTRYKLDGLEEDLKDLGYIE